MTIVVMQTIGNVWYNVARRIFGRGLRRHRKVLCDEWRRHQRNGLRDRVLEELEADDDRSGSPRQQTPEMVRI